MIFPSSGQQIHNVQLTFPDKDAKKRGPKFVRSDSEKRIPVLDVEKTSQGQKIKFIHNGIRMVIHDDAKVSKEEVIKKVKEVSVQLDKPVGTATTSPVKQQPVVHVHNSDEVMPTFIEKLTVGKYSPEKSVHHYLHGTGKQITDSFSYISGTSPPRSPQNLSTVQPGDKGDARSLLLDQYLNIHSLTHAHEVDSRSLGARISPGRRESPQMAVPGEFDGPGEAPSSPAGSVRSAVPRLDLERKHGTSEAAEPENDGTVEPPAATVTATAQGPPAEAPDAVRLIFDDSAPTTAIPGVKPPSVELVKSLSSITDQPASQQTSPHGSNKKGSKHGALSPASSQLGSLGNTPDRLLSLPGTRPHSPLEHAHHPPIESPMSTHSGVSLDAASHIDLQKLIPVPIPKAATTGPSSPHIQSITVKIGEGTTVHAPSGFIRAGGYDSQEPSARSIELDSLSALSDPTADGEPQQNAMERDRHSTRAVQLREQKTKAELVRMDSLVRKSDAPVYTSKKLVGVNTSSEANSKARQRLVAAARLVVAFRQPAKDKHTTGRVLEGGSSKKMHTTGPSFVIRPELPQPSIPLPPSHLLSPTSAQRSLELQTSDDDSFELDAEPKLPSEKKNSIDLSIMTDSVDDSLPPSRVGSAPTATATGRTGRSGKQRSLEHKDTAPRKVVHAVASKPALFDFNPGEETTSKANRKGVNSFISMLKERVGSSKAQALDAFVKGEDNEDDESEVTTYFDHNAAPIYIEREKAEKHVLHSKRFDPKPEAREYHRPRDEDNDSADGSEVAYYTTPGGAPIPVGGSRGGSTKKAATPGAIKPVRPNFDLSKFLATLSEEERAVMAQLPLEAVNKIMESMNKVVGGADKAAKTVNKKNVGHFKAQLEKAKAEKMELDRLNMDLQLELLETTDAVISVTANSTHGGSAIVLLLKDDPAQSSRPHMIMNIAAVQALPNLLHHECREIKPDSFVDVTFSGLRPETRYVVYVVADSTLAKQVPLTDEDKVPTHLTVTTLPEALEVEWARLTTEQQITEVKAALRTCWLRETAAAHFPPIILPLDDEVHIVEATAHHGQDLQSQSQDPNDQHDRDDVSRDVSKDGRHGRGNGHGKAGAKGKGRKMSTASTSSAAAAVDEQKTVWRQFLDWWVGQSPQTTTKVRAEFHLREALFAAQQESVTVKYMDSVPCRGGEVHAVTKFAANTEAALAAGKVRKEGIHITAEFRKFRSWYKGGQVLRDLTEAKLRSGTSESHTDKHVQKAVEEALKQQLQFRTQFLQGRVDDVDQCKDVVKELVASHAHAQEKKLKEDDLVFKRSVLSPEDLIGIMSTKRLTQLCVEAGLITETMDLSAIPVSAFGPTGKFNYLTIAKTDLFLVRSYRTLKPEDPPPIVMATLPGSTTRKPLKAWQLCSADEKMMEVALACSLDNILLLALQDRVPVPTPEDICQPKGKFPTRDAVVERFVAWYAGEEALDRIPGHAPPTLQRTVFGETWETDCVRQDPFVLESLYENEFPVPEQYIGHSSKMRASFAAPPVRSRSVMGNMRASLSATAGANAGAAQGKSPFYDPLLTLYRETISKVSGNFLRPALLARHLTAIIDCRRMAILRWAWPPGAARTGRQFLFPRMGLQTPPFDLPPARIKPFPSRRPDAYTHQEMIQWYPPQVLDEDDVLMRGGEAEGVRMRSYHNWLAQEKERQEETRRQMIQEDFDCHVRREVQKEVEFRLRTHANKLKNDIERAREREPDKEVELKFSHALPAEYWYIFEESQEYKHGSGIYNEDELEEYREAERQRARDAEIEAEKFENYLQEEIMRREAEEAARQRREEQDRRLAEGVARRRRLREHLEELKRAKQARIEEAERQRQEGLRREAEEAAEMERQRQRERERAQERARAAREQELMHIEDVLVTDNRARSWEIKRMEHEDIHSYMREQYEVREKAEIEQRYIELQELYQTFEPFPEHLASDNMRSLHGFLRADPTVERIYQEVMETLSQSSSHRSRVDLSTESANRKISSRYKRIFEGSGGGRDVGKGDADASTYEGDSTAASHSHTHSHTHNPSASHGIALHDHPQREDGHGDKSPYPWLRKTQPPPVRGTHHSPTKHSLRAESSAGLLPNTYDTNWNLLHTASLPCFVRTSGETFLGQLPATGTRSMTSLGPILQPLQETSIFQHAATAPKREVTTFAAVPPVSTHETDILRKFGRALPASAPAAAVTEEPPTTQPSQASPTSPSRHTGLTDSYFNDSTVLDSADGSAGGDANHYAPEPPAPRTGDSTLFGMAVDPMSQTLPEDRDIRRISFDPAASVVSSGGELGTFTASVDSTLSVFRSVSPSHEDGTGAERAEKQDKGRKKMKQLLSTSADMLAKTDQREWLQFLQTQRKATFASLATLDAKAKAEKARLEKLTTPAMAPPAAALVESRPLSRVGTPGQLAEIRSKTLRIAQLRKELKELGIVDESILDFRTRQLAKSASESVVRMQKEKAMLREYVTSGAVLRDDYYLLAVQPGTRTTSSLEVSDEVRRFAAEVTEHVDQGLDLRFPSLTSLEPVSSPPHPKPRSASTKARPTPKGNLRFGGAHDAVDLFIDPIDELAEAKKREPDVTLDLGVKSLSRAASAAVITANSSAKSSAIARRTKAPPLRPVSPPAPFRGVNEKQLVGFNSLASLSTLSGGLTATSANPLGVIRGSAAPVAKEATGPVRHRNAFYKANNSVSSGAPSTVDSQPGGSWRVEPTKQRGSTISKSVELYIHTPSQLHARSRRDGEDGSVASSNEQSADLRWQLQSPLAPQGSKARGSVASIDSASIVLDDTGSV